MNKYFAILLLTVTTVNLFGMEIDNARTRNKRKIALVNAKEDEEKIPYKKTVQKSRFIDASSLGLKIPLTRPQMTLLEKDTKIQLLAIEIQNELPLPLVNLPDANERKKWIGKLNECSDAKKLPLRSKLLYNLYAKLVEEHSEYSLKCPLCLSTQTHLQSEHIGERVGIIKRHALGRKCTKALDLGIPNDTKSDAEESDEEIVIQDQTALNEIVLSNIENDDIMEEAAHVEILTSFRSNEQ